MELQGKVTNVLEPKSGEGKGGKVWKRQDFVIEFKDGEYLKSACLTASGKAADHVPQEGDYVNVQFMPESREYNGKWYTNLNCYKIEVTF